jgi:hypothetical protein
MRYLQRKRLGSNKSNNKKKQITKNQLRDGKLCRKGINFSPMPKIRSESLELNLWLMLILNLPIKVSLLDLKVETCLNMSNK